jgi:CRP-like cAMP-binding protein
LPAEHPNNRVLASLPRPDFQRWQPQLEWVELDAQHTLLSPGAPIEYVHFPMGALIGLVHEGEPGTGEAPVALVGNDGVVGLAPLLGAGVERVRAVVLHPGGAWRMPIATLNAFPAAGPGVLQVVMRYLQALNVQMSQNALCRLHHTVPQRLCRWLLDAFDRVPGEALDMDVTALSAWLDADAEVLKKAAMALTGAGVIECPPHRIVLRDRAALVQRACDCHAVVKNQREQLFPPGSP